MGRVVVLGNRLRASGEFDRSNAAVLREGLAEVSQRAEERPVVDLTGVTYLDSSGLAALWLYTDRRPHVLVRAGSVVERILGVVGFSDIAIVEPRA